jgi:hypothetical protein
MEEPKEIDWVSARCECSLQKVFERIKTEVEADVQTRRNIQGKFSGVSFRTDDRGEVFIVRRVAVGEPALPLWVAFERREQAIAVTHPQKGVVVTAFPVLNDKGLCCLMIDAVEYEFWQFRKLALESLFFDVSE